jgi:hypothetical protein
LETGGVSLETGLVSKVAYLTSRMNGGNKTVDFDIYSHGPEGVSCKFSRGMGGNAPLIPLLGDMVSCTMTPLNHDEKSKTVTNGCVTTDAALGWFQVTAKYKIKTSDGKTETKTATVGRVVRLWNRE